MHGDGNSRSHIRYNPFDLQIILLFERSFCFMKYKLTIALITMNRAEQLRSALESCAASNLPKETEFVVVDNGSTDNTEAVAEQFKATTPYNFKYHKEPVNLGAGLGRNVCCELAEGEYIFILDDDAEISADCREHFFTDAIAYMDQNPSVWALTTDIVDKVFGERRLATSKTVEINGLKSVYSFHEGTVFFRTELLYSPLYMDIKYGCEHLSVSAIMRDKGYYVVFDPKLRIDHNPIVDNRRQVDREQIIVLGASNTYMIKKVCYPRICTPLLWLAYVKRLKNGKVTSKELLKKYKDIRKDFCHKNKIKKIKLRTVIRSYKEFGLAVF